MKKNFDDSDGWQGETSGREVYCSSVESSVLGPDGEPLLKSYRAPLGFRLRPSAKKAVKK